MSENVQSGQGAISSQSSAVRFIINDEAQKSQSNEASKASGDVKIPDDLIAEIKRRATDEALRGLKDLWKREIEKVYEDFDASAYRNFRDAIRALGDYMLSKARGEGGQSALQAPQEASANVDIERLKAQIKAEYEEQYKQEKRNMLANMAYDTLANYALSKGLNPKYKDVFSAILKTTYQIDFDDEDRLVYRKPDTKELILEKGGNPSLDYLLTPFLETHSELFSAPKSGAGLSGGLPLGSNAKKDYIRHENYQVKDLDTVAMIDAALKGG